MFPGLLNKHERPRLFTLKNRRALEVKTKASEEARALACKHRNLSLGNSACRAHAAQCRETTFSAGTKEEDGDVRGEGCHKGERSSLLENAEDGERRRQEGAALPGDTEFRHREIPPGCSETRQTQREDRAGEDGGRENAGAGHVLGRACTGYFLGVGKERQGKSCNKPKHMKYTIMKGEVTQQA
ncbi:hypothetical protein NDU88_003836 [Pleurodeles waltl]|uniref:Uncharacterized protein n=1 Tax=Pleurodeles waltl TaxID=8319 RepID=A0AAV7VI06_PLEWA|nr:hypothetical protein NDU88_003836 [Pleurodeles waltl]